MSQPDFSDPTVASLGPEMTEAAPTVQTMPGAGEGVAPMPGAQVPSKPKSNVYTVMLLLALLAQGIAITFLCLEMARYKWDIKAREAGSPSAQVQQLPPNHWFA